MCTGYFDKDMSKRIVAIICLLAHGFLVGGCVAVSQRKAWSYMEPLTKAEPNNPFIWIRLRKSTFNLPLPIVWWQVSNSKDYLLYIDFHTKTAQYKRLDSISYKIHSVDRKMLTAGTLPVINGILNWPTYTPDTLRSGFPKGSHYSPVHRALCSTKPFIKLGNQRQELIGSFVIYATDVNNQQVLIQKDAVALSYHKAKIYSTL